MIDNEQFIERTVREFAKLVVDAALVEGDRPSLEHLEEVFFLEIVRGFRKRGLAVESIADMFRTTKRTILRRVNRAEERAAEQSNTFYRLVAALLYEQQTATREELQIAFPSMAPETCAAVLGDLKRNEMVEIEKETIRWIGDALEFDWEITELDQFLELAKYVLFRSALTYDEVRTRFPVPDEVAQQAREQLIDIGFLNRDGTRPLEIRLDANQTDAALYDAVASIFSEFVQTSIGALRKNEVGKGWFYMLALPPEEPTRDVPFALYQQARQSAITAWEEYVDTLPAEITNDPNTTRYGMGVFFYERPFDD